MRVLLAAMHVPTGREPRGGVQSWVQTVRAELERRGHVCTEWELGMNTPAAGYDLGILANMGHTGQLGMMCRETVCISHGIIEEERPGYADRTLFVSEGVRAHWGGTGGIIRQPIDTAFWTPTGAQRRGAVRYSYRKTQTHCGAVSEALGLDYRHVSNITHDEARDILAGAALVFASGRAALEAMACGAPTVIYDHRETYQGPLLDDCLPRQMRNSYSGRGGIEPTLDDLIDAAGRAMEAGSRRAWVEKHHGVREIVKELLA